MRIEKTQYSKTYFYNRSQLAVVRLKKAVDKWKRLSALNVKLRISD